MKKLFYLNKSWSNAVRFYIVNFLVVLLLMGSLTASAKNLSHPYIWTSSIFLLFLFLVFVFLVVGKTLVKELEIEKDSFTLKFFLFESKKYSPDQLKQYATALYGGYRYSRSHSVILEFEDGKRYQVADPIIDNYSEFYEFIRTSEFECFGYIGQNSWRRKHKALSKKWVVERDEKELIEKIGKKKGVIILYLYGLIALGMSLGMIRYLIVFQ
ncbi:hypothetical protein [Maribellus sediminis]|uniref:hypothetical protein n=1 Tax=Maribellus sediminis TaxID=2696285 RepID=UPI00142F4F87|nr:hypothetical protein [Maribellus sediminis]